MEITVKEMLPQVGKLNCKRFILNGGESISIACSYQIFELSELILFGLTTQNNNKNGDSP